MKCLVAAPPYPGYGSSRIANDRASKNHDVGGSRLSLLITSRPRRNRPGSFEPFISEHREGWAPVAPVGAQERFHSPWWNIAETVGATEHSGHRLFGLSVCPSRCGASLGRASTRRRLLPLVLCYQLRQLLDVSREARKAFPQCRELRVGTGRFWARL